MYLPGLDLLKGKSWTNEEGKVWAFRMETPPQCLLNAIPLLPSFFVTNVKPYPLTFGTMEGITPVIEYLKGRGRVVKAHSPYNALMWLVH